jgi:hypothetical protein
MIGMAMVVLPLALVMLSLPSWFARADLGRGLAQDIARTAVRSADLESGLAAADALVAEVAGRAGLSAEAGCSEMCVSYRVEGALVRGAEIEATVTIDLPGIFVPFVGTVDLGSWTVAHVERVDDFRSLP